MMQWKFRVTLTDDQRTHLTTVMQEPGVQPRTRLRAQILLKADTQASDRSIASALDVSVRTVFQIRKRFVEAGLEAMLAQRHRPGSRPGGKSLLDGEAEAQLVALAQGAPPTGQKCWTLALLANALIERGLVQSISRHTVREKLLKYGLRLAPGEALRMLNDAQEATLVALARSAPPDGRHGWTAQRLADTFVERRIVESLSAMKVLSTLRKHGVRLATGEARRKLNTA